MTIHIEDRRGQSEGEGASILPAYLTTAQLAERWQYSPGTLANMRCRDEGPDWVRFGRQSVRYPCEAVLEYERGLTK